MSARTSIDGWRRPPPLGPHVIAIVGVTYVVAWGWFVTTFGYLSGPIASNDALVVLKLLETLVVVGIAGSLVYGGVWFRVSGFTPEQEWWGTFWTLIGGLGITGVVLLMVAHHLVQGVVVTQQVIVEEILVGGAGGSLGGLLVGIGTAETYRYTDEVAEQRDVFAFLNALLRHNVLNGIQVIQGKAVDGMARGSRRVPPNVQSILNRCRSIAELTQNVSDVAYVVSGDGDFETVDLSELLRSEVETARSSFEGAQFVLDVPAGVDVEASNALRSVFDNLLTNAVRHNDAATPEVHVSLRNGDGTVAVEIADNGPGIDHRRREELFEPSVDGHHGMGLYLVETIVSHHDGRLVVEDNEPRGSVFTVELPKLRDAG